MSELPVIAAIAAPAAVWVGALMARRPRVVALIALGIVLGVVAAGALGAVLEPVVEDAMMAALAPGGGLAPISQPALGLTRTFAKLGWLVLLLGAFVVAGPMRPVPRLLTATSVGYLAAALLTPPDPATCVLASAIAYLTVPAAAMLALPAARHPREGPIARLSWALLGALTLLLAPSAQSGLGLMELVLGLLLIPLITAAAYLVHRAWLWNRWLAPAALVFPPVGLAAIFLAPSPTTHRHG